MKILSAFVLSFFCLLSIAQAQSLDAPSPSNAVLDYFNTEMVLDLFASETSAEASTIAFRPLGCKCLGDINRDGNLNLLDVAPFVNAVQNGFSDPCADMNQDGVVDLLDVDPFIEALETGGCGV